MDYGLLRGKLVGICLNKSSKYDQFLLCRIFGLVTKQFYTNLDRPVGLHEADFPNFPDIWYMQVVRLSALDTGRLYPRKYF